MFSVKIITPTGLYREVETSILNVVTTDGARGVLTNHVPLVTMLKISKMSTIENNIREEYAINSGMLYFKDNLATILTDSCEHSSEIDVNRALAAKERAENRLAHPDNIDIRRAEAALSRAINRLNVSGRI
ncbi:MAG: ATP synthase F1 subunit epsilon [Erysipelotrichales bacterium]|nr:ATP synthase F1 subunit epsilon [Erysipelotrichales bacterium]